MKDLIVPLSHDLPAAIDENRPDTEVIARTSFKTSVDLTLVHAA
jgi:hypothetical protein